MRLTVLGKSPAWQDVDGACSGYLLEEEDTRLLLDCGNGVFAKLRRFTDYLDVDAVVVSHLHADHVLDLVPFSYALTYAPRQQPVAPGGPAGRHEAARPILFAPSGGRDFFRRVVGAWGSQELVEKAFALKEYDAASILEVGGLRISFSPVPHFIETYAICVESTGGGGRLVYGADCAPAEELVQFATGADLFLVEATLPSPEQDGPRGHLTAEEAGEHGRRAGVGRVVLTHVSDELDEQDVRERATRACGAEVEVAHEGAVYEVG